MISFQAHLIKFWDEKCLRIIECLSWRRGGHRLQFSSLQVMPALPAPIPSFQGLRASFFLSA